MDIEKKEMMSVGTKKTADAKVRNVFVRYATSAFSWFATAWTD